MKTSKSILLLIAITLLSYVAKAQQNTKAAGFRLGHISGLTYQNHFSEDNALEVMLTFHKNGIQGTAFSEWYTRLPLKVPEDFYFYYGVGGHLGYRKYSREKLSYGTSGEIIYDYGKKGYYSLGIDGIAGMEYRIYEVPMIVSLEIQPVLDFYGLQYLNFEFFNIQAGIKYIF